MLKRVPGGFKVFDSTGKQPLSKLPKTREAALRQLQAVEIAKYARNHGFKPGGLK